MSSLLYYVKIAGSLTFAYFAARMFCNGPANKEFRNVDGKIVIITGSSAGIGKEAARDLLRKGMKVIFACRDKEKTLNVINQITTEKNRENAIFIELNLTSFSSVQNFVSEFSKKFDKLDILINNAGLFNDQLRITEDGLENTLQTNHLSHFILTGLLLKFLKNSDDPRVINVSSKAHEFIDNSLDNYPLKASTYKTYVVYGITKAANIIFSEALKEYAVTKKDGLQNLTSASLHPGIVNTEFSRTEGKSLFSKTLILFFKPIIKIFSKDEWMGAQTTLHCVYLPKNKFINGGYYKDCSISRKNEVIRKYDFERKLHKITYDSVISSKIYNDLKEDSNFVDYIEFFKIKFTLN